MARFRTGLLAEVLVMAVDTLKTNKLRSALTVLGVVIGVTSIVGMTSLIRGFGDQMETLINQMGANSVYVAKMSISSFRERQEVHRRPATAEHHRRGRQGDQGGLAVGDDCRLAAGRGPWIGSAAALL